MTETLSLISVLAPSLAAFGMAYAWYKDRVRMFRAEDALKALQDEHLRWSDRDEKGRFVKRERGSSI